jgi:hypothetical protein
MAGDGDVAAAAPTYIISSLGRVNVRGGSGSTTNGCDCLCSLNGHGHHHCHHRTLPTTAPAAAPAAHPVHTLCTPSAHPLHPLHPPDLGSLDTLGNLTCTA